MSISISVAWDSAAKRYRGLLGHNPGDRLTRSEDVARAVEELAKAHSGACRLTEYGKTYEGRPLQLLTFASPANLKRLDDIKARTRALAEDPENAEIGDLPATVWIIANVHGDEHSTADAALMLACHLAGGDSCLENAVVCIDPLQNPDGRARSVNAYYSLFGLSARRDPQAAEHSDPWPGGRGNHYLFDLNRDWFPMTQPESQARVRAFLEWRPQLLADLHEMWSDSHFFFPPPAQPLNPNYGAHITKWWSVLGRELARTFDEQGWMYWTGEVFDAFYPGYGEAFPCIHGCAGMTFEQAGVAGIEVERRDGSLLTFEDAVRHHFGSALTVCRTAAERRKELLAEFRNQFNEAPPDAITAFIFEHRNALTERIAMMLERAGIPVRHLIRQTAMEVTPYAGGDKSTVRLPAGTMVVPATGPTAKTVRALLERETHIDQDFLNEQIRRREENASSRFYDHTVWSIPVALGLSPWTTSAKGLPLSPRTAPKHVPVEEPEYGFLIPAEGLDTHASLCRMLNAGLRPRVSLDYFGIGGADYGRGTIVVRKADHAGDWKSVCKAVHSSCAETFVRPAPLANGWTDAGLSLGSDEIAHIPEPKVAVLYDRPASGLSYGWIAWLFEQKLKLPFTPLRSRAIERGDLRKYETIILPNGSAEDYAALSEDFWKRMDAWLRTGGTLITIGGASAHLASKGKDWTTCRVVKDLGAETQTATEEPVPPERRPERVNGAALRILLDRHQCSSMGFSLESTTLFNTDLLLTPSVEGRNGAVFAPEDRLVAAGFVWERMKKALPGKACLVEESHGNGRIILFADDPNQRGYWEVSARLFANSVLFSHVDMR